MSPTTGALEAAPAISHRQIFESRYRGLPQDQRAHAARTVSDPDLSALCFDPMPAVIRNLLDNPSAGLLHARLICAHHPHPLGLEAIAARVSFTQDREVQRLLLRNVQTPDTVVRSLFAFRQLTEVYRFSRSHDFPERHRESALRTLRRRIATATPDERVELITTTEGRALAALPGLVLDGRTVALLCLRGALSMQLIENLARWPASPPKLLEYLLKQPLVGQYPTLKQAILRHPHYRSR